MDPRLSKPKSRTKIFVAMSGGVDSSVTAALLKQEGYDVTGVFMKNWSGDDFGIQTDCPWEVDQKDVEAVCKQLDIPFRSVNFEKEYRDKVVAYFFDEIEQGRTPNPDVMCNKEIKFKLFLDKALELGADLIATGHYARCIYNPENDNYELHKGVDSNKDQSYFLNAITQEQLSKTLFPIGEYNKPEIRKLAHEFNLVVADKPDSQGICFIGEINVKQFLRAKFKINPGKIIDIDTGANLGNHDGIEFYTIGQREGLNIGGAKEPYYVVKKDYENNMLYVAMGSNNPALYSNTVKFTDLHLISDQTLPEQKLSAAIRYRQNPTPGKISKDNPNLFIFEQKQRAVASGQSIVFYDETKCLGGGIIID